MPLLQMFTDEKVKTPFKLKPILKEALKREAIHLLLVSKEYVAVEEIVKSKINVKD